MASYWQSVLGTAILEYALLADTTHSYDARPKRTQVQMPEGPRTFEDHEQIDVLNKLGAKSWRAVSVYSNGTVLLVRDATVPRPGHPKRPQEP